MSKRILVTMLCLSLAGCLQHPKAVSEPEVKSLEIVSYILTTRSGDTFEIQDFHYKGESFTLGIFKGNVTENIPLSTTLRDMKKLEVLEIVDWNARIRKLRETNDRATKLQILRANPEGIRVRITYDDGDVLEGIIRDTAYPFRTITGSTKHGTLTVDLKNIVSIEKQVEEVEL